MTLLPSQIIEVAVPLPIERTFHYLVPSRLSEATAPGKRVLVPFGNRRLTAYVLAIVETADTTKLKEILDVLDDEELWTKKELEFFRWIASYYMHPLGEVLRTALPAGINLQTRKSQGNEDELSGGRSVRHETWFRAGNGTEPQRTLGTKAAALLEFLRQDGVNSAAELRRRFGQCTPQLKRLEELGLVEREQREVYRDPFRNEASVRDIPRVLNQHQQTAFVQISSSLDRHEFSPFLLHGVTGSGKTEVYLQAIAHALEQGRNALVLVPEISLTPQLVYRFRARFGGGIAILHSGLSDGERYDEWRRIRRGLVRIVIGARSAIFAPLEQIGIIVVDEEHEASFKQADNLRYNARDLALVRGQLEGTTVVLGSATPLVTTLYAVEQGRLGLLELPTRAGGSRLPVVETIAMQGIKSTISPQLHQSLVETVAEGGQAIIFLNRRGFATFLVCGECSQPLTCPNCSVTLTYHRQRRQSVCHYCDYAVPAPGTCPSCGALELKELGAGTERVEHDLVELLPQARILRMDSDTTSGKGSHNRLLSRMADGSADILIGTQMITKGHDFPGVTLVGVISAEASLNMPDFRSSERTFQVLSQVFGRAGRGDAPGRVLLQALNPTHYAIQCAINHDGAGFYQQELEFRRETGYPPFAFLAAIGISGTSEQNVGQRSEVTTALLLQLKNKLKLRIEILGPAPAPLYRLRGRFRRQILLKAHSRNDLRRLITDWLSHRTPPAAIREMIDIDPVDMM
ncbi:replication restart helicase PriA [Pelotalea chapellei]|uniref:Replication restart protein PriA n=1 Tax=Pelotalea chapellei TaxID=44671 RepID=A0ABS5U6D4_9BACT|nr:primosomal protein N' [Pelotalea chapellei]MBT1071213.1 primosomal protein N' [Pelotalea chapellei]